MKYLILLLFPLSLMGQNVVIDLDPPDSVIRVAGTVIDLDKVGVSSEPVVPFLADLDFYSNTRSGLTLENTVGGEDAYILPAIYQATSATGNYISTEVAINENSIAVVRMRLRSITASRVMGSAATSQNTRMYLGTGTSDLTKWRYGWGNTASTTPTGSLLDTLWHTFIMYGPRMWKLSPIFNLTDQNILSAINDSTPDVYLSQATWSGTSGKFYVNSIGTTGMDNRDIALCYLGSITDNVITWAKKIEFTGNKLYEFDHVGNTRLNYNSTSISHRGFSEYGSRALLDNGFSRLVYGDATREDEFRPNDCTVLPSGYTAVNVSGYANKYNTAPALINIPSDNWNKNDTSIWTDGLRNLAYHDTINPNRWYMAELSRINLLKYAKHRGYCFTNSSSNDFELFSYRNEKVYDSLQTILNYVYGPYTLTYTITGEDDYISWKITDQRLVHYDAENMFTYDLSDSIIYYSYDNGVNWNIYEFGGQTKYISMVHSFQNGNVLFATRTKLFNSLDSLNSISEVILQDTVGSDYVIHTPKNEDYPGLYYLDVQRHESYMIDGNEFFVFANYSNSVFLNGASPSFIMYSRDNGQTVKIAYEFGQNPYYKDDSTSNGGEVGALLGNESSDIKIRHAHSVTYDSLTNKFYACTGDFYRNDTTEFYENHWISGDYDWEKDYWQWVSDKDTSQSSRFKSGCMKAVNGYLYFTSDATSNSNEYGFYSTPINGRTNEANHTKLSDFDGSAASFIINGDKIIGRSAIESSFIFSSADMGANINISTISNLPDDYKIIGKLDNGNDGYYKFSVMHEDMYSRLYEYSRALLIKIK